MTTQTTAAISSTRGGERVLEIVVATRRRGEFGYRFTAGAPRRDSKWRFRVTPEPYVLEYYVEARDAGGAPIARIAAPDAPLEIALVAGVREHRPWYRRWYLIAGAGRSTLTPAGASASEPMEPMGFFDLQLAIVQHQLIALHAANRAADPSASCEAASRIQVALRTAEKTVARMRERTAQSERADVMAVRVSAMREECRVALEESFAPSGAAIREAVAGSDRQHWDREVAAWPATRGHAGSVQHQPAPGSPLALRPVLTLRLHGEAGRAKRPILLSIAAEVLDVGGVIERVLARYGVPADRVKELDHLAIAADPAGSPGITKADVVAGAGSS